MKPYSKDEIGAFMELAIKEAHKAYEAGEVPVGAILVSEHGEIISSGYNCPISSMDPTAHAEIVAIRSAAQKLNNYRLTDTIMFVTLEPCIMCAGALVWARISKLFFGAWDKKSGAFGSVVDINTLPGLNHRIEVAGGIFEKRCAALLQDFFRERREKG